MTPEAPAPAAVAQLRSSDPVLDALIGRIGTELPARGSGAAPEDHYGAIVRAIIGQQVSTKAAAAIWGRLLDRFGGRPPAPAEVLAADHEELRAAAGLSHAKARYLRSLAGHVADGSLDLAHIATMPDDEVLAELVAVDGIGPWTAQIFLMFHLRRPDVLPAGDLGVRQAAMRLYGLPAAPAPAALLELAEPWRPHRTLACRYLWASLRNEPSAPAPVPAPVG